jgi:hypothetical protein
MPAGFRLFKALSPRREMLSMTDEEYRPLYEEILAGLDPQATWDRLHELAGGAEPIILCHEADRTGCHRLIVARWFERELGDVVDEWRPPAAPSLFDSPV